MRRRQERAVAGERASVVEEVLAGIRRLVVREQLFARGDLWVIGVSGGQDSLCLLHALTRLAPEWDLRLHVFHLDHGFRGAASAEDARFVAAVAQDWGWPATVRRADVPRYAREHRLSPQAAARAVRYQAMARVTLEVGARGAIVAHTADDVVETMLINLIRGTGLAGLAGLRPRQSLLVETLGPPYPGEAPPPGTVLALARPLLDVDRASTGAYCRAVGVQPRVEAEEATAPYLRNRVRHHLLPVLENYNPSIRATLRRSARALADDLAIVEAAVSAAWEQVATARAGLVAFDAARFAALSPPLRRELIRSAHRRLRPFGEELTWSATDDAARFAAEAQPGQRVALPGGLELARVGAELVLRVARARPRAPRLRPTWLPVPGRTAIDDLGEFEARLIEGAEAVRAARQRLAAGCRDEAYLDADRTGGPLVVRSRLPGDSFVPLGMGGEKKLQDLLVDAKVPPAERDRVPIVASPDGIVWVVGHRIAERVRVRPDTRRVLYLRFHPRADVRSDPAPGPDAPDSTPPGLVRERGENR